MRSKFLPGDLIKVDDRAKPAAWWSLAVWARTISLDVSTVRAAAYELVPHDTVATYVGEVSGDGDILLLYNGMFMVAHAVYFMRADK